jgi:hypothetical protein
MAGAEAIRQQLETGDYSYLLLKKLRMKEDGSRLKSFLDEKAKDWQEDREYDVGRPISDSEKLWRSVLHRLVYDYLCLRFNVLEPDLQPREVYSAYWDDKRVLGPIADACHTSAKHVREKCDVALRLLETQNKDRTTSATVMRHAAKNGAHWVLSESGR